MRVAAFPRIDADSKNWGVGLYVEKRPRADRVAIKRFDLRRPVVWPIDLSAFVWFTCWLQRIWPPLILSMFTGWL